MDRVKRIWYLSSMRATKVQASLRICAVSPEPPLLAHTSIESRGTLRQKARSLAPLNGWACAVKTCHDGMLKDTNSLDVAHIYSFSCIPFLLQWHLGLNTCYFINFTQKITTFSRKKCSVRLKSKKWKSKHWAKNDAIFFNIFYIKMSKLTS